MQPITKSIVMAILMVLISAFVGGVGVAIAIINPFGIVQTSIISIGLVASAVIFWGWSCFARK